MDRCAAWQRTLLAHNDSVPNAAFMTYVTEGVENSRQWVLAKISPALGSGSTLAPATAATNAEVADFPGGIEAAWSWGEVRAGVRFAPALSERPDTEWTGAAAYQIHTQPPSPVMLHIGGGWIDWFHSIPVAFMVTDSVAAHPARITIMNDETLLLESTGHPLKVVLHAPAGIAARRESADGQFATIVFPDGAGTVYAAFAETRARALVLARPRDVFAEVREYYDRLLGSAFIETPDELMDRAFASAVVTNEYCWFEPFGWIESVHHWVTFWHQQHVGMAPWLGQHDRARLTNIETGRRALENGAIPHLQPTGRTRRDFGGANQYYAWQVLQYYRKTADADTIRELAPVLRAGLAHTLAECDVDGNLLIGWGLQIGNQEDFISTPHDGTSPSTELLNIIESVRLAEELLGNRAEVDRLAALKDRVAALIIERLVDTNLQRPIFMRDPRGVARLDGQYHSLIYPVLADILPPELEYAAIRHLRDRLTGPEGETYVSNNFADHLTDMWSTWGMQAGAAQQPWAVFAYNKLGMVDAVVPPLRWIATKVHNDIQRGTWPEVANELRPGYFSPPAALWIQAVVEALFGLQLDVPGLTLVIRPCFPAEWNHARIVLPEFAAEFARDGDTMRYEVRSARPIARDVRWPVALDTAVEAMVNGELTAVSLEPGVGSATARIRIPATTHTVLELTVGESASTYHLPASMTASEAVSAGDGAGRRVLERARAYGKMGQITFSRRTLFVEHPSGGVVPHDYLLLPDCEAAQAGSAEWNDTTITIPVTIRNNRRAALAGEARAFAFGHAQARVQLSVPPRAEARVLFEWRREDLRRYAPGEERVAVQLPGSSAVELTVLVPSRLGDPVPLWPVAIPAELRVDDADYLNWREWYNGHVGLWKSPETPLYDLKQMENISSPELPEVVFPGPIEGMALAGGSAGREPLVIPVEAVGRVHKVYLLTCAFVNNHDVFAPIAEVELVHAIPSDSPANARFPRPRMVRRLHFPGDLDAYYPEGTVFRLATYDGLRVNRHGILPLLPIDDADWPATIAKPPYYPDQPIWADSAVISTPNAIFNVIEVAPPIALPLDAIIVRTIGTDPVLGVAGVVIAAEWRALR